MSRTTDVRTPTVLLSVALSLLAACGPQGATSNGGTALSASPPAPANNVPTSAKTELGRMLFWDPVLSGDRDIACASCHHPDLAYADGRPISIGTGGTGLGLARTIRAGAPLPTRNSMTVLNTAWNGATARVTIPSALDAPMFWDNRAHSLEQQARGPLTATAEMMGPNYDDQRIFPEVVARLQAIPEYVALFDAAFGADAISADTITAAIATFERTLSNTESSYDRYVAGDTTALTAAQQRGLAVFNNGGCARCHSGPMFSDFALHDLGVPDAPGAAHDVGDGGNRFRTASLRNATRTAPYMHNGSLATLDDVYRFYARADDRSADPDLQRVRAPRGNDAADVTAFLQSLSDGAFDTTVPERVPSGLAPGGGIH